MHRPSSRSTTEAPTLHVALLRGLNVGGKNKLPMTILAGFFEDAGCGGVRTYIQSGNVVFTAAPSLAAAVPTRVTARIEAELGFLAPVIVRSAADMDTLVVNNPYLAAGADAAALHVAFLAQQPSPAQVAALDPQRSPPDRFTLRGSEIYLWLPNGVARTKLTNAYLDARLGTVSTMRNWRTVQQLHAMSR